MASAILITTSQKLAEEVSAEIDQFVAELSRKEIIQKSLDNYGYILVADNMEEAIDTVNAIASEHMEIVTADPFHVMTKIRNAGAIFIGEYSSEPLGDYFAGYQTMFFRQTERPNSFPHFPWMILLKSPALFLTHGKRLKKYIKILSSLQNVRN